MRIRMPLGFLPLLFLGGILNANAQSLTLRGTLSGLPCTAVDAVGAVAYVASSGTFRTINLADPVHPVQLGQTATGAATISAIEVNGNVAYGAGQSDGLVIVNVQNASSPSLVTRYAVGNAVRDVAAADTLVAVATPVNVVLLGVRSPATPHVLATYGRSSSWVEFAPGARRIHVGSTAGAFYLNVNVTQSGGDTTFTLTLGEEYGTDALTPVALAGSYVDVVRSATLVALHANTYALAGQRQSSGAIRALAAGSGFCFTALATGTIEYLDQRSNTPQLVTTAAAPGSPNALALGSSGSVPLLAAAHSGGLSVYEYGTLSAGEPRAIPRDAHLTAFPNPFNASVWLQITPAHAGQSELVVSDVLGRIVWHETLHLDGPAVRPLDFHSLPGGVYFARWQDRDRASVVKLLYLP